MNIYKHALAPSSRRGSIGMPKTSRTAAGIQHQHIQFAVVEGAEYPRPVSTNAG